MMERYKLEMQKMYEDTAGKNLQREEQFPPPAKEIQNETDTEQLYGTGEPAAEQEDNSLERFDELPEITAQRIPETQPEMIPEGEQRTVRNGFYGTVPERMRQRISERQAEMVPEIRRERAQSVVPRSFSEEISEAVPSEKAYGEIVVSASSGRGAYPISGASVVIDRADKNDPAGRQELIASLPTDESGKTKPIRVSAVSREYSLEPGNGTPFSTYFVTAVHDGYIPIRKRPVDVFGGEISLLELELIPKPEGET